MCVIKNMYSVVRVLTDRLTERDRQTDRQATDRAIFHDVVLNLHLFMSW